MQGRLGWIPAIIVSVSILCFSYGLYSVYMAGSILGETSRSFSSNVGGSSDFQARIAESCAANPRGAVCPHQENPGKLASCWAKGDADAPGEAACAQAWSLALSATVEERTKRMQGLPGWIDARAVKFANTSTQALQAPYLLLLASLAALFAAIGYGVTGSIWGIAVNQNRRLSLSQSQAVLWSTLIISGYAVMALFNVGAMAWSSTALDTGLDTGKEIFPDIDWSIFALMGLAAAVPMTTSVITGARPLDASYAPKGMIGGAQVGLAAPERNEAAQKASLFDLFLGEDIKTKDRIDLTRVQNLLFSVLLLMAYSSALVSSLHLLGPGVLLDSASTGVRVFEAMPSPGANFLTLAGLANAAYLIGKFTPGKANPAQPAGADDAAAADQNIGAGI